MRTSMALHLRSAAATLEAERISLGHLLEVHGPAAHGSLLLLLAVLSLLPVPGAGTALGLGLVALSVAMCRGNCAATLPRRVCDLQMSRAWGQRVLCSLAVVYETAARVARPRLQALVPGPSHTVLWAAVAAMAVLLALPIPFGNFLPAVTLILLALGIVFSDGLVVVAGYAASVLTGALFAALAIGAAGWLDSVVPVLGS